MQILFYRIQKQWVLLVKDLYILDFNVKTIYIYKLTFSYKKATQKNR